MKVLRSVQRMQRLAQAWRRASVPVALVPTMGYLHAGHLSLVKRARVLIGSKGRIVVSIYVNPTQFAPNEDFSKYPRDLSHDTRLCRDAGVDVIFAPSDTEMYAGKRDGSFSTYVVEEKLSAGMEGVSRPTHFRGVTTVVAKLFNIVLPQFAVFGAKDYQQAAVIKRMVCDLNLPLKIIVGPTYRESDGLAMSSRNKYLKGELRAQALALSRSLAKARSLVRSQPKGVSAKLLKSELKAFIEREPQARVDYVEFFEPNTLVPVKSVKRGTHMAVAVFIGKTRLIDNAEM